MEYPRDRCQRLIDQFVDQHYPETGSIPAGVERPPDDIEADFSLAWPMRAGNALDRNPRDVAEELTEFMAKNEAFAEVTIAGPGFVNLSFDNNYLLERAREALNSETVPFPAISHGKTPSVLLEFVSANPTGPLHVGHGRGAIYGDTLGRLLELHGCEVDREYYVNDAGTQMERLGESLEIRLEQQAGVDVSLGEDHYKGEYLEEFAEEHPELRGEPVDKLAEVAREFILEEIFTALEQCGIEFDRVVSEREVATDQAREKLLERLEADDMVEEREGALFLRTTEHGDDKDRVLIRSNGEPTYFANDLVYHNEKFERGFDRYVDVWGHDHHGYQKRLEVGLKCLGHEVDRLEIELYQLVDLYEDGEPVAMSTRGGEFVTLEELREKVGVDALRVNFLTTNHNRPLDFDISVATSESEDNPVYYVQYAHTRMASIKDQADTEPDPEALARDVKLTPEGHELLVEALDFPHRTKKAAVDRNPHNVVFDLKDLAGQFHSYYGKHRVLDEDFPERSEFRLALVEFLRTMFEAGLTRILNVEAPVSM